MFFHFSALIYSIAYFLVLESVSQPSVNSALEELFSQHFRFGIALILLLAYVFYRAAKSLSQRAYMAALPVVFATSSLAFQYFFANSVERNVSALLSAGVYYLIHIALYRLRMYRKDQTARGILAAGTVATIFLAYSAAFGIYLNFDIGLWVLLLFLMAVTTLASFQYFWLVSKDAREVLIFSILIALSMTEIAWMMNFWPFGYLTTGVVGLIFYYVFWDLVSCHFAENLSKRRVVANVAFAAGMVALVLASSKWLPVV